MTSSRFRGHLSKPIAGLTLLTFFAVAVPAPGRAQIPGLSPTAPTGVNRLQGVPVPESVPAGVTAPCARTGGASRLPPNTPYTLGAGDRVRVDVFDVPEYSGEFVVLVDGTLNLPVIGSVNVQGVSLQTAKERVESRYSRFVKRPLVTLSLLASRPIVLAVAGEVQRPGTYTVSGGQGGGAGGQGVQTGQFPTVTQALTLAGGVTQSAEICQVRIRRRGYDANNPFIINLWDLLQNGNLAQDVPLRDGDTIVISAVSAVNPSETRQLADASFASKIVTPINIAVVGEVARPGPYSVTGGSEGTGGATGAVTGSVTGAPAGGAAGGGPPTLTKAIQVAGGITSLADVRSITIRRVTRSSGERFISVNLWDLLRTGDLSQDVILQDGDTITIPTATALDPGEANQLASASFSPNTIVVNVVGEVTRPGAIPVPPNTPLNQAVLAAGGFDNRRARKRSVELVRLNPNGTVERRDITVDLAQGINDQSNPTLRNNDVVLVRRSTLANVTDTLGTILSPASAIFDLLRVFGIRTGND